MDHPVQTLQALVSGKEFGFRDEYRQARRKHALVALPRHPDEPISASDFVAARLVSGISLRIVVSDGVSRVGEEFLSPACHVPNNSLRSATSILDDVIHKSLHLKYTDRVRESTTLGKFISN
jgi:hypothetical protein